MLQAGSGKVRDVSSRPIAVCCGFVVLVFLFVCFAPALKCVMINSA